jgi:hypothetical protein
MKKVYIKINLIWTKSALVARNFCDTNMVTAEFQKKSTGALIASWVILF